MLTLAIFILITIVIHFINNRIRFIQHQLKAIPISFFFTITFFLIPLQQRIQSPLLPVTAKLLFYSFAIAAVIQKGNCWYCYLIMTRFFKSKRFCFRFRFIFVIAPSKISPFPLRKKKKKKKKGESVIDIIDI